MYLVLGIGPGALRMLNKCSTTELSISPLYSDIKLLRLCNLQLLSPLLLPDLSLKKANISKLLRLVLSFFSGSQAVPSSVTRKLTHITVLRTQNSNCTLSPENRLKGLGKMRRTN